MNLGIIGMGYVGDALENKFKKFYDIETYDLQKKSTCNSLEELFSKSDIIFLCLPTPMKNDGSCDTSIISTSLNQINNLAKDLTPNKIIIIKSTIPIGSTKIFQDKFENLDIIFNPEFLTEANHLEDFENQNRIILGGDEQSLSKVVDLYSRVFPGVKIIETDSPTAEMVKYFANSFLATKVSFANEMFDLCKKLSIDYDKVVEFVLYDKRIGPSHLKVPGNDNKRGYGGSCFPKDVSSLITQFNANDVKSYILKASWERNKTEDRPSKDWEELKGRAVSDE